MLTHRLMVSVVSAGLLMAAMALPARAQVLDDDGVPYSKNYYRQSINNGTVTLRRGQGLLPGQFIVHLEDSAAPTSGCGTLSKIPAMVQYTGKKIQIDYLDYTVDMRDQPAGLPARCVKNMPAPSADVILDTATLKEQGITKIRLSHHGDKFETTIDANEHRVRLWPPYANKGKSTKSASGKPDENALNTNSTFVIAGAGASTLWFYPEDTVILYVTDGSTAEKTKYLHQKIDELAATHGMKPLENTIPEFKSPLKGQHAFYYTARKHAGYSTRGQMFDKVQVDVVNYGIQHDEQATKDLPVFIRKPGQND